MTNKKQAVKKAAPKSAAKKAAPKKSVAKKVAAPKPSKSIELRNVHTGELMPEGSIDLTAITFNKTQQSLIDAVLRGATSMYKTQTDATKKALKTAVDTGEKLMTLQKVIKGMKVNWTDWCKANELVLGIKYRQVSKLVQIAKNSDFVLDNENKFLTINDASDAISWNLKDDAQKKLILDKKEASESGEAGESTAPSAPKQVIMTDAAREDDVLAHIDAIDDLTVLRTIIEYTRTRIVEIQEADQKMADDAMESDPVEPESEADVADAVDVAIS